MMNTEDKRAVQQAIGNYSHTFESGDAEGWANIFTKDGVWEFFAGGAPTPTTRLEGRVALKEFAGQRYQTRQEGITSYHHQSGIIFDELTSNSA